MTLKALLSIVYSKEESLPASCAAGGRVPGLAAGVAGELRGAAHLGPARRAAHRVELRMRGEPGPGLVRVLLHLVRHQRVQVREAGMQWSTN